ncbi:MAG: Mov34/MPN/PAD-1 family protein [Armatimonadetes bacterium]|nr:Mov34/MPN/PAD-1 family protein [Armatimonadota bacterium]
MMGDDWEAPGEVCPVESLAVERARDFARLVGSGASPFAEVFETRKHADGTEVVVLEVAATVPQRPKVAIARIERLSVAFTHADSHYPDIRALRQDFPRDRVLHLNGGVPDSEPASLCLFEEAWPDVRIRLTAAELLFRIQNWLTDTASGKLHRKDQPLEPAFMARFTPLVLSSTTVERLATDLNSLNLGIVTSPWGDVLFEQRLDRNPTGKAPPALVLGVVSAPHGHSIRLDAPTNLADLHSSLEAVGIDLLSAVRERLLGQSDEQLTENRFMVITVLLMRQRTEGSEAEPELVAFTCTAAPVQTSNLITFRAAVGLTGQNLDQSKKGESIVVRHLSVRFDLSPQLAARYSGESPSEYKLVGIGAGALGSQIVMNAVRGGLADWHIVDNDVILPHNLVRHALSGPHLGHPKTAALASEANTILDVGLVRPVFADMLAATTGEALNVALDAASAIVDMSASVAVAKHIASDLASAAKRCSIFAAPSGRDLVFLGEDGARQFRLDHLEAQYYRAVAEEGNLKGHMLGARTIGSCRDITAAVSQALIGGHAGQGSRILRDWLKVDVPVALVLRSNQVDYGQTQCTIPLGVPVEVGALGDWSVHTDTRLLESLRKQRLEHLPNETGGVLLAHLDIQRKTIYVCHAIPAPSDSDRQPTVYIRGTAGLLEEYERIRAETLGGLVYVGEWHSHPDGSACSPSDDDFEAGISLAEQTRPTSIPGLLLIVGERQETCWMLCQGPEADGEPAVLRLTWNAD